jgi:hypothetical protein
MVIISFDAFGAIEVKAFFFLSLDYTIGLFACILEASLFWSSIAA